MAERRSIFGDWLITLDKYHKYRVKNLKTEETISEGITSVSQFISQLFPKFEPNKALKILSASNREQKYKGMSDVEIKASWLRNGSECANLGTSMHSVIEQYLHNRIEGKDEFHIEFDKNIIRTEHLIQVRDYLNSKNLIPVEIEKCVFDKRSMLAGTIDAIFKVIGTDELVIVDWKRKTSIKKDNYFDSHTSIFPETEYEKIKIQLNLYNYLFGDEHVSKLICIAIHPDNDDIIVEEFPIDNDLVKTLGMPSEMLLKME